MRQIDPVLQEKLEKLISGMGYEFVGCEQLSMDGRQIFRIFIDQEKGVTVEDCSQVSHQVSAMLDAEDAMAKRYHLEVSSPGIDRPLFEIKHYQKYIGCRVKIKLHTAINQRRQLKGILQRVAEENVHVLLDGSNEEVVIPFSAIAKGNLLMDVRI